MMKTTFVSKKVCGLLFLLVVSGAYAQKDRTQEAAGKATGQEQKDWQITEDERKIFNGEFPAEAEVVADSTEYEVIVFDPGFNVWLQSVARPRGYYSQGFMEQRNLMLVNEWNLRFQNPPSRQEGLLYENRINYEAGIDYGYEVNYVLYNYFLYFQRKNGIRLTPLRPSLN